MKKHILYFLLLHLIIVDCNAQSKPIEIFGNFKGINRGFICMYSGKRQDSICAEIKNGKFYFKTKTVLPALFHFDLGYTSLVRDIYIDSAKTYIDCANTTTFTSSFSVTSVRGSNNEKIKSGFEKWQEGQIELKLSKKEFNTVYYNKLYTTVKANNKELASLYLISQSYNLDYDQIIKLADLVDKTLDNTPEKKQVKELLNYLDKSKNELLGTPFLDVTLSDTTEKKINTKDLRGKYVLIDFWGSYCKPCMAQMPSFKLLYSKFKTKNFEIIGISFDKDKINWKKAIAKNNLNWKQVIDTKGSLGELGQKYNVEYIPRNILIDKNGLIVGVDLNEKEIEAILLK